MPESSRADSGCLNEKYATPCANKTSISASVRTLAAAVSANARNQNCQANAPMKPANIEGFHNPMIALSTSGPRARRETVSTRVCTNSPTTRGYHAAVTDDTPGTMEIQPP